MGYRSEVAVALTDDAGRLLGAILEHRGKVAELVEYADGNTLPVAPFGPHEDRGGKIHWEQIKWYEGYEDIDAFESFLALLPGEDYYFIRLGEDTEDNEQRGEFYDSDMYISRSIVW